MRKNTKTTIKEQGKAYLDTIRAIEDTLLATYGCLLPSGEVNGHPCHAVDERGCSGRT
ncbi:hypothetical protein [Selenomonas sp. FC4001]|uniref:hypothetical protein n=1 Tax=Selenomonas sp. FC4001 TaxID=1408313 RepID=UPI0018CBF29C|nr:hypothetical protein [Selenomonas sp. FC4001]